jgi:hypothetical protein
MRETGFVSREDARSFSGWRLVAEMLGKMRNSHKAALASSFDCGTMLLHIDGRVLACCWRP